MGGLLGGLLSQVAQSAMNGNTSENSGEMSGVIGNVLGAAMGENSGGKGMLMAVVMPMLLNWVQTSGGLSGALEKAKSLGLEEHVQSWLSSDNNMNLDASQVTSLFGADKITEVASKVGSDEASVVSEISKLLPEVLNKLTPQGGLENETEANLEIGDVLSKLSSFL